MLRCLVQEHPKLWDELLGQAEFAYNSMPNRSTGVCPFKVVYTKPPNHTIDIAVLPKCHNRAAVTLAEQFNTMLQDVRHRLIESNKHYKAAADKHRRAKLFQPGDLVMVRLRRERLAAGTYSKLGRRKVGPVPITRRINDNAYIVDLPPEYNTSSTFNVADLSAYHPPDQAATILSSTESDSSDRGGE
ncbi:hypothetical protein MA16_Dca018680 [Dendrobium catenatum]|uniref:Tf2-1-like SH3-like domain-containing protein n=1 Tax=Dendrobium catenatum TaxID=906689 RepID=A0A2I0X1D9_9ASPA|nr:hypothetical protein MA16_Dca018680 [Dendrobium catenatum]